MLLANRKKPSWNRLCCQFEQNYLCPLTQSLNSHTLNCSHSRYPHQITEFSLACPAIWTENLSFQTASYLYLGTQKCLENSHSQKHFSSMTKWVQERLLASLSQISVLYKGNRCQVLLSCFPLWNLFTFHWWTMGSWMWFFKLVFCLMCLLSDFQPSFIANKFAFKTFNETLTVNKDSHHNQNCCYLERSYSYIFTTNFITFDKSTIHLLLPSISFQNFINSYCYPETSHLMFDHSYSQISVERA